MRAVKNDRTKIVKCLKEHGATE